MSASLRCGRSIEPERFARIVRTMALDHHKWDAQVGDVAALAPHALVVSSASWRELAELAAGLARETAAIEEELVRRPELHARLGLPRRLAEAISTLASAPARAPGPPRILRFDFHPTADGWRVSEVNSDVPGGFTESSRFAALVADAVGEGTVPGDAAAAWCDAIARAARPDGAVALLTAPGWVEDTQVVSHLAARLRALGLRAHLVQPHHLSWTEGRARIEADFAREEVGAIVRFYQAEWIAELPCRDSWQPLLAGARTPVTNPGSAALTESKRLPLVWHELHASTETWRRVLPDTCDPREARDLLRGDWVLKPAFGNTGDDVSMRAALPWRTWARRAVVALAQPHRWVAQRRFRTLHVDTPAGPAVPCIGVYVVDGRVAGAYGRLSTGPIVDYAAIDAAVLIDERA